ncbi:CHASE2 domain-containing protein [Vibrio chaetopteri]|uniref:CHASE2 domain-containing protein n=1 Tax=Vibrio chaetopteri TaxID=3016528 RepID=UPI003AB44C22
MKWYHNLNAWIRSFYSRFSFFVQWLLMALLGIWLIYGDPYGLGSASDKAGENAIYRIISGQYDASRSEPNILIVLFNDRAIDNLYPYLWESNDWPLSYSDQVNLLSAIMVNKPLAIFYDVMWMKKRSLDASYSRALQKIQAIQAETEVPLYFARGAKDSKMDEGIKADISSFAQLAINGWEGEGELYPLFVGRNLPTTATALYHEFCQQNTCTPIQSDNASPMSVRWNSNAAEILLSHRESECRERGTLLDVSLKAITSVIQNVLPWLEEEPSLQVCSPQRVLYADELLIMARSPNANEREQVRAMIEQSVILVGGQIEGIHDYVVSPVHGALPGVFFHAMALDNLITFGQNYTREDKNSDHINFTIWLIYITLLVTIKLFSEFNPTLRWLNERLWLMSGVFIILVLGVVLGWFNYAPSSWVSILALGWFGNQLLTRLDQRYGQEYEEPNQ